MRARPLHGDEVWSRNIYSRKGLYYTGENYLGTSQNSIQTFLKKKKKCKFLGFYAVASISEDLSIDVSITNVGLILTKKKLRWLKFNFGFLWKKKKKKKKKKMGFSCCSTCEDLSIDVSITNTGLILTKLRWFLISGYGQTDRHNFGILKMETGRHPKIRVDAIFKLYLYNITVFKLLVSFLTDSYN